MDRVSIELGASHVQGTTQLELRMRGGSSINCMVGRFMPFIISFGAWSLKLVTDTPALVL